MPNGGIKIQFPLAVVVRMEKECFRFRHSSENVLKMASKHNFASMNNGHNGF
jgi:hypothetical protein